MAICLFRFNFEYPDPIWWLGGVYTYSYWDWDTVGDIVDLDCLCNSVIHHSLWYPCITPALPYPCSCFMVFPVSCSSSPPPFSSPSWTSYIYQHSFTNIFVVTKLFWYKTKMWEDTPSHGPAESCFRLLLVSELFRVFFSTMCQTFTGSERMENSIRPTSTHIFWNSEQLLLLLEKWFSALLQYLVFILCPWYDTRLNWSARSSQKRISKVSKICLNSQQMKCIQGSLQRNSAIAQW